MAATTIGNSEARKIRKMVARLVIPNSTMLTGIQASGLIGRRICTTASSARAAAGYQPIARPTGTPNARASAKPLPTRSSESPM